MPNPSIERPPPASCACLRPPLMFNVRHHMQRHFTVSLLLAVLPWSAAAANASASAPESLYTLSVQSARSEDGTPLTMTIRETRRAPDFSIVDIEYVSGGSASSLLLVRGLCGLMRARDHELAVAEQISEHPVEFRMTFPTSAKVEEPGGLPRMVLSESDCARIQERHE